MTVSTAINVKSYTGDGSTTGFSFPYLFYSEDHLNVFLDGTLQVTGYTVSGEENPSGGTVTFSSAPGNGVVVIIERVVPLTQETDLENFDGNPADVTEKQFDLLAMADQQLGEKISRAITVQLGTTLTSNTISGTIDGTSRLIAITTAGPAIGPTTASFETATNTAVTAAATATTQAGIATTQAGIATTQAGLSAGSAALAASWATGLIGDRPEGSAMYWAEQAEGWAQAVNLPSLGAADTVLQVNSAGTALEYGKIAFANVDGGAIASEAEAEAGTAPDKLMTSERVAQAIAALAESGGLVPIKTVTASNSATVDFVNGSGGVVLDGTYDEYVIEFYNVQVATDGVDLYVRASVNGGSSYLAGSEYLRGLISATGGSVGQSAGTAAQLGVYVSADKDTPRRIHGSLKIITPTDATRTTFKFCVFGLNSSGAWAEYFGSGDVSGGAAVNAIRFLASSGNITSGTFSLYGVKKPA